MKLYKPKSKSANRNYTSINKRILTSIASNSKASRRSKKQNGAGKLPPNKLRTIYANARGIKSKMQSLKQIILSKPCHIFAITETLLKDNEKVNIQHFKWIGLNRQNKDGGGIGFLINKSIIKSCIIEPNLNKTIEFMSIKLNLTDNESMMVCLYYGKQESRSTKKESQNEFNQISTCTKNCIDNNSYVLILGDFNAKIGNDQEGIENGDRIISRNGFSLRDMIKMQHLQLVNSAPCCVGKWTRVKTCNNNEKSIIDYGLCNSKLTSMM